MAYAQWITSVFKRKTNLFFELVIIQENHVMERTMNVNNITTILFTKFTYLLLTQNKYCTL